MSWNKQQSSKISPFSIPRISTTKRRLKSVMQYEVHDNSLSSPTVNRHNVVKTITPSFQLHEKQNRSNFWFIQKCEMFWSLTRRSSHFYCRLRCFFSFWLSEQVVLLIYELIQEEPNVIFCRDQNSLPLLNLFGMKKALISFQYFYIPFNV
jgi:hypothetical protein